MRKLGPDDPLRALGMALRTTKRAAPTAPPPASKPAAQSPLPLAEGATTEQKTAGQAPAGRTASGILETCAPPATRAPAARVPSVISEPERELSPAEVVIEIKRHAIGGIAMLPYPEGFIFCGVHAAPELAKRANMRELQGMCVQNYMDLKPDPREIHLRTRGDELVVCMATSINEDLLGGKGSKPLPVLINFVMPARLKEDFQDAVLNEPGFAKTFLRGMSPLFRADGPRARDQKVRAAIFLESDFSRPLLIC